MQSLAVSGYSAAAVRAQLRGPSRAWDFRFDVLTRAWAPAFTLSTVAQASVTFDASAAVRRTLTLDLTDDPRLDPLRHWIRPWARLEMPDRGFAEWACGTFLLTTAPRHGTGTGVTRTLAGYDAGQILQDDQLTARLTAPAGAVITDTIDDLLVGAGLPQRAVIPSNLTLPVAQDWPPGTPKATVIGDLLRAINYRPLWFDALGVARIEPALAPASSPIAEEYADNQESVTLPDLTQTEDSYAVPNRIVVLVSQPDRSALTAVASNDDPASPVSTISRGRTITKTVTNSGAVDQTTADAIAARLLAEASQLYETITWQSGILPYHADQDAYRLVYSDLGLTALYQEQRWMLPLQHDGTMQHTARRIVVLED